MIRSAVLYSSPSEACDSVHLTCIDTRFSPTSWFLGRESPRKSLCSASARSFPKCPTIRWSWCRTTFSRAWCLPCSLSSRRRCCRACSQRSSSQMLPWAPQCPQWPPCVRCRRLMQVMSMVVVSACLMFRLSMGATCQSIERGRFIKNIHSEYYSSYTYRFFGVFSECTVSVPLPVSFTSRISK